MNNIEAYLTTQDLASTYGVCLRTVRKWVHQGGLRPDVRLNRIWRFRRSNVENWMKKQALKDA